MQIEGSFSPILGPEARQFEEGLARSELEELLQKPDTDTRRLLGVIAAKLGGSGPPGGTPIMQHDHVGDLRTASEDLLSPDQELEALPG